MCVCVYARCRWWNGRHSDATLLVPRMHSCESVCLPVCCLPPLLSALTVVLDVVAVVVAVVAVVVVMFSTLK